MSFGFRVTHDEWDETVDPPVRTVHAVELREVSVVSEPAYEGTSIALRSLDDARKERRQHNFNAARSEEHTSELQSLMRISYAVFCMQKEKHPQPHSHSTPHK